MVVSSDITVEYTVDGVVKTKDFTLVEGDNAITIEASDAAGNIGSDSIVVTFDNAPPAAPTGLTALGGDTAVGLSWTTNAEPDLAGYNIYRSEVSGEPYIKVNTEPVTTLTYRDTELTNDTTYYYVITAQDTSDNESEYSQEVSATPQAWIINFGTTANAFSPNGDGHYDATNVGYTLAMNGYVTIKIYDADDILVRTLINNLVKEAGYGADTWDGADDNGQPLPEAAYTFTIDAVDTAGNPASQQQGTVTIDNHYMIISSPPAGSELSGQVTFTIVPSANTIYEGAPAVFYRSQGTTNWGSAGVGTGQSGESWQFVWDTTALTNGVYEVRLGAEYTDLNGNRRRRYRTGEYYDYTGPVEFTIQNPITISNVGDNYDAFSPDGNGKYDVAVIGYRLSGDGYVTIKIYDSSDTLVRILKDGELQTAGTNTTTWDGADDNGQVLPDGTYTYKIDAQDSQGGSAPQQQGTLTIDNHFMVITEPVPGSELSGQVTFSAQPSDTVNYPGSARFYYRRQGESSWIDINAVDPGDGTRQIVWDTPILANGAYEMKIALEYTDLNGYRRRWSPDGDPWIEDHTSPVEYAVQNPLTISKRGIAPNAFSPNGDGHYDRTVVRYYINLDAYVTIKIYDANDLLVRTLRDYILKEAGFQQDPWYGTDDNGQPLPEGTYAVKIDAVDTEGNPAAQQQDSSTIDNHYMIITSPPAGSELSGPVTFTIVPSANTSNEGSVRLYYRTSGTTNWGLIGLASGQPGDSWQITWDTETVPDNLYELRIGAAYIDLNGMLRRYEYLYDKYYYDYTEPVEFTVTNVAVSAHWADPSVFSPNADGIKDTTTITAVFTDSFDWSLTIEDSAQTVLRTFSGSGENFTQVWDGTDSSDTVVADGTYTYTIGLYDPATGSTASASGTVDVDNTPPAVEITSPLADEVLWGKLTVSGSAQDSYFASYLLQYAASDNPAVWVDIFSSSESKTDAQLAMWDTFTIANGPCLLKLTAQDQVGNTAETQVQVNLNNVSLTEIQATPQFFDPSAGETSTISFNLSHPANITLKVYQFHLSEPRVLVAILAEELTCPAGPQSFLWDPGPATPLETVYTYSIEAYNPDGRYQIYDPEYVFGITSVINANLSDYNPAAGQPCIITYDLVAPSWISLQIGIDQQGAVRVVFLNGLRDVTGNVDIWDGRDDDGNLLPQHREYLTLFHTKILPENSIAATNKTFKINSLTTEAYLIVNSYNQISTISYEISHDALVTVKIYDPNGNYIKTLADNEFNSAGSHSLEWDGTNEQGELVHIEGDYTVELIAAESSGNITLTRKGNIIVYK